MQKALEGQSCFITNSTFPTISLKAARTGASTKANELGMRPMQERAYEKRGEQYLLIKSPPASGKSRALMFIALDKLHNQGLKQAIIVVPETVDRRAASHDEPLTQVRLLGRLDRSSRNGTSATRPASTTTAARSMRSARSSTSDDKVLVCTHATFRFAVDEFGVEAFDDRLIAVDEFHHVSRQSRQQARRCISAQFIARDRVHIVAMTGSYFRGDAEAGAGARRTRRSSIPSPTPTTSSSTATSI